MFLRKIVALAVAFGSTGLTLAADEADEAGDDVVQLVLSLLADKDKDLRAVGLEQVRSEAKGSAATRRFAGLLPNISPEAQAGLLSALADRQDAAARPAVIEILANSKDDAVRVAAIRALGSLGDTADLAVLAPLTISAAKAENAAARSSLIKLQGDGVARAMALRLKDSPTELRVALIEILTARRALDTIGDLLAAGVDVDPKVRAAAMTALGQLAGPEHVAGMTQGVLKATKGAEREGAEKAVMLVCGRIADASKREEPLLTAMGQMPPADRAALLPTLGRIGGPTALVLVEKAIAEADPGQHAVGVRAICNWPDAAIAPRLIELHKTEQQPEHRALVLAALIRLAPLPDKRSPAERLALVEQVMGMCGRVEDQNLVLKRARAIRTPETLRFVLPYVDQPQHAEVACETIVELAHYRDLREPNKAEFHKALDKVMATSKDSTVQERADRYKKNQTWAKPTVVSAP